MKNTISGDKITSKRKKTRCNTKWENKRENKQKISGNLLK